MIIDYVENKNPQSNIGVTPLHLGTRNGHLSVSQMIIANVDDKNLRLQNQEAHLFILLKEMVTYQFAN